MQNVLFVIISLILSALSINATPNLLLISLDGFRADLLNETLVPNIYEWATQSAWFTKGSESTYISFTAPNHMSIATGLYQESHGILSNYFYDTRTKHFFDYFNYTKVPGIVNSSLDTYWFNGEPIWLTNERGGSSRSSAVFYWPMSEAAFSSPPHHPTMQKTWSGYRNFSEHLEDVDNIIDLFLKKSEPSNFVSWYIAEPDHTLHENGFTNGALKQTLADLDKVFAYLLDKLKKNSLDNIVNVILTADHGHAEIKDYKHIMCLKDYLNDTGYKLTDHMIYPKDEAQAEEIFQTLSKAIKENNIGVKVHRKNDFPGSFNYKNSDRVGSIILEPLVGFSISFSCSAKELEKTYGPNGIKKFNSSTHGMDPSNPEMRAILVMSGPAFAKHVQFDNIPKNVDLYPLMCHILNITAAPNNGSLSIVSKALLATNVVQNRGIHFNVVTDNIGFFIFIVPPTCLVLAFLAYGCKHTILKDDPQWARSMGGYRPLFTDNSGNINSAEAGTEAVTMSGLLKHDYSSDDEL